MFHARGLKIEALGYTWHFTGAAIQSLHIEEQSALRLLRMVILEHGSAAGYEEGSFEIETNGFRLHCTVRDRLVTIDVPVRWAD